MKVCSIMWVIGIAILLCSKVLHGAAEQIVDSYVDVETTIHSVVRPQDGKVLKLVASDEFNKDGRSFEKGMDKMFEAVNKPDNTNEALQFCKIQFSSNSI